MAALNTSFSIVALTVSVSVAGADDDDVLSSLSFLLLGSFLFKLIIRANPQYIPHGNDSNDTSHFNFSLQTFAVGIPRSLLPLPNPFTTIDDRRMGNRSGVIAESDGVDADVDDESIVACCRSGDGK